MACKLVTRAFSQFGKSQQLDTIALLRKLEEQGLPRQHAEAILHAVCEISNYRIEPLFQRTEILQGSFKAEQGSKPEGQGVPTKTQVQSSQGHPLDLLHHDLELERLRNKTNDLKKVKNEYRELVKKRNPMEDNYKELSAEIEATRRDIRYCMGAFTSVYVVVSAYVLSIELKEPGGSTNSST